MCGNLAYYRSTVLFFGYSHMGSCFQEMDNRMLITSFVGCVIVGANLLAIYSLIVRSREIFGMTYGGGWHEEDYAFEGGGAQSF